MNPFEWPARIRDFLSNKLWEIEPEQRSRLSAIRLLQFSIMVVEGFVRDRLLLRASALSYFTVISLVPLLAVVVAIASALGFGSAGFIEWMVDVLSADAVKIHPGDAMRLEAWGGDEPLRARVRRIEPSGFTKLSALGVEEQRVNVIGDFVDPPGALGDGYRLEARIVVWHSDDVLRAPASAIFRRGEDWYVFAASDGRALLRRVGIAHRGADAVEIEDGLEPGAQIVLHPTDRVEDGVRIEPFGED